MPSLSLPVLTSVLTSTLSFGVQVPHVPGHSSLVALPIMLSLWHFDASVRQSSGSGLPSQPVTPSVEVAGLTNKLDFLTPVGAEPGLVFAVEAEVELELLVADVLVDWVVVVVIVVVVVLAVVVVDVTVVLVAVVIVVPVVVVVTVLVIVVVVRVEVVAVIVVLVLHLNPLVTALQMPLRNYNIHKHSRYDGVFY